jgi:ABC-2 type transport system permease protein
VRPDATLLPALFLSGMSFPSEVQAGWVRVVAVLLPSTFGIQGFLQLAEMGARLEQTLRAWWALWIQVVVYWTLAWLVLRYKSRCDRPHGTPPSPTAWSISLSSLSPSSLWHRRPG